MRAGMNDPDPGPARRRVRVGPGGPYPGSMHTWPHQAPFGLLEGMDPSGWIGDKGYVGRGMITPHKKPPNGELDEEKAKEENKSVNRIRQVVERTIAHIKSWRIHPHCLQETPGNIRADDHRSTRTIYLQNHPLNNLPDQSPRAPPPPHPILPAPPRRSPALSRRPW